MATKKELTPAQNRARQIAELKPNLRAAGIRDTLSRDTLREAYEDGKNLSRYLESMDPSENHPAGSGDAFNRVLMSCGIRTRSVPELGIEASTLEDVVIHPRAQYLAVEIFARAYRNVIFGKPQVRNPLLSSLTAVNSAINQPVFPPVTDLLLRPAIPLSEVISQTQGIRGTYYKPFYLQDVQNAHSRVAEAAEIPAVKISTAEKAVDLHKYGRRIDFTYEADRRIPIDMVAFQVQRIAIAVEAEKLDKVLNVIISGDGNAGTSATSYNVGDLNGAAAAGVINMEAWLNFKMQWANPLMMTTVLGQPAEILKLMLLDSGSVNVPLANINGLLGAQTVTPINQGLADGVRAGWLAGAPAAKLVAFDKRVSVLRLFEVGSNIQETAQDVKSQINSLVLSEVEGYAIIDPKANKVLVTNL